MSQNPNRRVRTRFAPSPTGYLHLGGARTALFSWAFAKHHDGDFILRIEDTDLERSTPEAVQAILDGVAWLDLTHDEGPFYQMQRMDRYREVIASLLESGQAYYCYSSPEEVQTMREVARARGLKPRYDGTWRPEPGKTLPAVPADRTPVVRFKTPVDGVTTWNDMVKGIISIANTELDDLVIARQDGTPTYNFCVVVDDWDMGITHVIRGDDHVNNTPRQINIMQALGAELPVYGHVPMILGPDGEKLSKRHGAVSVMDYERQGYLAEGMINYLARLGWSHGDDEIFDREQLIQWFDGSSLSRSASQWDPKKLNWVNAHYIQNADKAWLAQIIAPRISELGGDPGAFPLEEVVSLLKERSETLADLAQASMLFYGEPQTPDAQTLAKHVTDASRAALIAFLDQASECSWERASISALIKQILGTQGLKMPQLAIPLRLAVVGTTQTPAIDAVLEILGKKRVMQRLQTFLSE
ncbi:glutamate--tRNA ligase [Orrella marina]|uniref:Glutamate--tRNA ligase n=1 Tax=Orrella marina TaxID=2163011 RepID=A0A2R4XN20_9BURK|nr:glutamate--tRNA ligase [Orrella marina]AWB35171.1 glutamate--tRNA ligase [Orrella marina]